MKRKVFMLMAAILACEICSADIVNVELYKMCENNGNTKIGAGYNRSLQFFPYVVFNTDTGCLTISSPVIINTKVLVTDKNGNVLANECLEISPEEQNILLDDLEQDETYRLEITYGDTCLYGYIIL